jgi:hypothetical protein
MSDNEETTSSTEFKPGATTIPQGVLIATQLFDLIETRVVDYMAKARTIDPSAMRDLIATDAEALGSYKRKIERTVRHHMSTAKAIKLGRKAEE